jgi:hypothetical protein
MHAVSTWPYAAAVLVKRAQEAWSDNKVVSDRAAAATVNSSADLIAAMVGRCGLTR